MSVQRHMGRNAAKGPIPERVYRDAERRFAEALDSGAEHRQHGTLARWLAEDPMHAAAYAEVERWWRLSGQAAAHPSIRHAASQARSFRVGTGARRLPNWLTPAMAVVVGIAVVCGGVYAYMIATAAAGATYATGIGQQRRIALQDGSIIRLDTASTVVVRYGRQARRVTLLSGRAAFDVKHDAAWPFVVSAGGGTVTDVGTRFQVDIHGGGVVGVVLVSGAVSVAAGRSVASLAEGQGLQFDSGGIVHAAHPVDLSEALGWMHGEIVAHDWTLEHLVREINRYNTTKLEIAEPSLGSTRVTGTFEARDDQALLHVLALGWSIQASRVDPDRIVLHRAN